MNITGMTHSLSLAYLIIIKKTVCFTHFCQFVVYIMCILFLAFVNVELRLTMNTTNSNSSNNKTTHTSGTLFCLYFGCLLCCLSFELDLAEASSIVSTELERYLRTVTSRNNGTTVPSTPTHNMVSANEDRILMDVHTYAFLNYSYLDEEQQWRNVSFNEEKARYGEGKIMSVMGKLVHITDASDLEDDSACSSNIRGTLGQTLPSADISWVALVRRGHCTFEEKVKHVHAKGAVGVIVYNDRTVLHLEKMQIKDKTRKFVTTHVIQIYI